MIELLFFLNCQYLTPETGFWSMTHVQFATRVQFGFMWQRYQTGDLWSSNLFDVLNEQMIGKKKKISSHLRCTKGSVVKWFDRHASLGISRPCAWSGLPSDNSHRHGRCSTMIAAWPSWERGVAFSWWFFSCSAPPSCRTGVAPSRLCSSPTHLSTDAGSLRPTWARSGGRLRFHWRYTLLF